MPHPRPIPVMLTCQARRAYDLDAFLARHPALVPERVSYKDDSEDPAFSADGEQHFIVRPGTFFGHDGAAEGARDFVKRHRSALEEFSRGGGVVTVSFDCGGAALPRMTATASVVFEKAGFDAIELHFGFTIGPREGDEDEPEVDDVDALLDSLEARYQG